MKEKCYKILEAMDNLSITVNLSINGEKSIHSIPGIFLSIASTIVAIVMFYSLILEIFKKDKPTVNYNKIMVNIPDTFPFNSNKFMFAIGIKDKYHSIINDDSYATIEAIYEYHTISHGQVEKQDIPLKKENCSKFEKEFRELGMFDYYETNIKANYYCYNPKYNDNNDSVFVGGLYGTEFYGDVAFHVKPCINGSNVTCKTKEEIKEKVNGGWFQVTYSNGFIDNYNYSNPIHYSTFQFYNNLDMSLNKIEYLYFNPVNVYTENNIILDTQFKESVVKIDYQKSDINEISEGGDLYTLYICPSNTIEEYKRKYIKIQAIGSSIGGFFNCLHIVAYVLAYFFNEKTLGMTLINSLFKFSDENENNKNEIFRLKQFENKIQKKQSFYSFYKSDSLNDNSRKNSGLILNNTNKKKINNYLELDRSKSNSKINKINEDKINNSYYKSENSKIKMQKSDFQQMNLFQKDKTEFNHHTSVYRRIIADNNKPYNDNYIYEIYLSILTIVKMSLCPCIRPVRKMNKTYDILMEEVYEYLNVIKIYHNFLQSYMISSFIRKKYKVDLKYEKDNVSINAFDNWHKSNKFDEFI